MKRILTLLGALCLHQVYAQQETNGRVGINTQTPNATLQVQATTTDPAKGVLIPQMTGDELKTMTNNLTAQQHSMLVFVTKPITDNTAAGFEKVILPAYYRFQYDDTKEDAYKKTWVRVEPSGLEKIKQNGKTGWRLIGADPKNYGNIGIDAVDLSYSWLASTTRGATGERSVVMGVHTTASGNTSTAMGFQTTASGTASTAMGLRTTASGEVSTAMGNTTTASGNTSTAMGYQTKASGVTSTAMGYGTTASGYSSTAMGNRTKAIGYASFAMGEFVESTAGLSMVIGHYNHTTTPNDPNYNETNQSYTYTYSKNDYEAFVIGNGLSNTAKSNAFIVLRNGKTGIGVADRKPVEMLEVAGAIKLSTTTNTCSDTNRGTIKYENDNFYGCKSTGWVLLNN